MSSTANYELRDIKQSPRQRENGSTNLPNVVIIDSADSSTSKRALDRYNLVYIILIIHGIGTLMPWNMFINAEGYFRNFKLVSPNTTSTDPSWTSDDESGLQSLRKNFLPYLGIASQVPNVVFNGLNLLVNMGSENLKVRVNFTLVIEAIVFTVTIILAIIDSSKWPAYFFYLTMATVVLLNMASGIYQNCVFGTGAKFPGAYTNAILIGSNCSGTFTSIVDLLSIWLAPKPQEAAIYYFATALFVITICLITYNLLPLSPFFRYYDRPAAQDNSNEIEFIIAKESGNQEQSDEIPETLRKTVDAMVPRPKEESSEKKKINSFRDDLNQKWQVFLKCWPQCLNVFLTFFVTLALFPSILADIKQSQENFDKRYFTSFACFFIFNIYALVGNLISGWTTWPGKHKLWIFVLARFLFVPFFLFCNFHPASRHWPVLINNDIIFITGNVLFAVTSGYLSSLCMMFASSNLQPDEAPKAGMLAAFFLVLGIFLGIHSSFFLAWIVELG